MKTFTTGELLTVQDLNDNFAPALAYLGALNWGNDSNSQHIDIPAGYDEIVMVWYFYNTSGGNGQINLILNEDTSSTYYYNVVGSTAVQSNAGAAVLSAETGGDRFMGCGRLTIKYASFSGGLVGYGQATAAWVGGYQLNGIYLASASALSRIDITPLNTANGKVVFYGRKYQ